MVKNLFLELRRRNVIRAAAAYAVVAWFAVQASDIALPAIGAPAWTIPMVLVLSILGFPLIVALAWFYELTPKGLKRQSALDRKGYRGRHGFGRQVDFVIIALLIMAVGWLVAETEAARQTTKTRQAQAERMVDFMIGRMSEPLDSSGNLAALDSIGAEVLDYYASLSPEDMDEAALSRRTKALLMTGKIEDLRGDLEKAEQYFTAAFATTAELLERKPMEVSRMYDHAQSSFYVGYLDWRRGKFAEAEKYFLEYLALAGRLAAAEPGNLDYQGEVAFANSTLGTLYYGRGRFLDAAGAFSRAHRHFEKIITFAPDPEPWKQWLAQTHAWLGEANMNLGDFAAAESHRLAQLGIFEAVLTADPGNLEARKDWIRNKGALAELALNRGDVAGARKYVEEALAWTDSLVRFDPHNTSWLVEIAAIHLGHAEVLLFERDFAGAGKAVADGRAIAEQLTALDSSVVDWQIGLYQRSRLLQAKILLATGKAAESLELSRAAAEEIEALRGNNPENSKLVQMLCTAYFQLGEAERRLGNTDQAGGAWAKAVEAVGSETKDLNLRTKEILAKSLIRLGRAGQAAAIAGFLRDIGYRYPDYVDFARQARN
ncbi:MAG TPA: hypothetical protein VD713_00985 [Sphingomonadales bacterium]|nr:hypothetical protein [Sphingomonadales bacterium]